MRKIYLLLLISLFTLPVSASLSESKAKRDSTLLRMEQTLEDIVVTATRTPLPLKNSPVITRVISGEQIQRQGIPSLEELLQKELAGVEFHQAGYGTTVSFQGLDARYVLFLIDGERMSGETYGNIDYQRIPISNIDRVEIVRGASSVLYGSNAMGAIVNVITKMPIERVEVDGSIRIGTRYQRSDEDLGPTNSAAEVSKYRKRLDLPNTRSDFSVGFNLGKFRSQTVFSYQTSDAYKLVGSKDEKRHYKEMDILSMKMGGAPGRPGAGATRAGEGGTGGMTQMPSFEVIRTALDTTIYVEPDQRGLGISGWRDLYVGQKFDYTINERFRIELSGNFTQKDLFDFKKSIMDSNPLSGIMPSKEPWSYQTHTSYNTKFLFEHTPNANNKIYLTFMRDQNRRDEEKWGEKSKRKQRHTYNIPRLLWTAKMGESHRLTTGLELINERLEFDLVDTEKYGDKEQSITTGSLYIQDEMFRGRKLSFVAGVRADWNNRFGWRITPQVSAKYTFSDFILRGSYSAGYRSPSLKEMYMHFDIPMAGSPTIEGNPNLKVETNHYLSLSLAYNYDWLSLSATVNKSFFKNKIDVVWMDKEEGDESGQRGMQYQNIDKSEYGSVELIGRFRLAPRLHLNANYNYVWESKNAPENTTQYIFPSPHTATLSLDYGFKIKDVYVGLNANVRYVGAKDYEDFMSYLHFPELAADFIGGVISGNPIPMTPEIAQALRQIKYFEGSYTARHSGYAICGASVNFDFYNRVNLTFGVNNIFNYQPKVVNFNSALTPRVNGFVKVGFSF